MTFVDSSDRLGSLAADVCVVGGGAAGISIALRLIDLGRRVVLVEGGGLTSEDPPRRPFRVLPGTPSTLGTDPAQRWFFGGNTNTWSGNCRPLDAVDFDSTSPLGHGGFPLLREELTPYYESAQDVLGLGSLDLYDPDVCRSRLEHPPADVDPAILSTRILQVCPVPSLASRYAERLDAADDLHILLRTEAVRLLSDPSGERVTALEVTDTEGRSSRVEADVFVLAAGGVENARILLDSAEGGFADTHDLVGRFFMEHWWVDLPLGDWTQHRDFGLYRFEADELQTIDGTAIWGQLALSEAAMRREGLLGLCLWFHRPDHAPLSLGLAWRASAFALRRKVPPWQPLSDARLALADPLEIPRHLGRRLTRGEDSRRGGWAMRLELEQAPDPENRVRLSRRRDGFGRGIPELTLRMTEAERRLQERAAELAAGELGLKPRRLVRQMRAMLDGGRCDFFWHHMGSTRMSADPSSGVVDTDCRVHGVANLYVAGSSVFPRSGIAPPTLSIVALALRLGDHLGRDRRL